jgi:hypothetical protein
MVAGRSARGFDHPPAPVCVVLGNVFSPLAGTRAPDSSTRVTFIVPLPHTMNVVPSAHTHFDTI